jgi:MFS family permease
MFKPSRNLPVEIGGLKRIKIFLKAYPRQFWLLFWGMLISYTGMSMIWPFLVVYLGKELELPLTIVASLLTINAMASLLSSLLAGAITDRIGRKWAMVSGLAVYGITFLLMIPADTYFFYAALMAFRGIFQPLYAVGANAMVTDLVPAQNRDDAFALIRLSENIGVAIGPALGGIMASRSYNLIFIFASAVTISFSILIAFFASETLPAAARQIQESITENLRAYLIILRDKVFSWFAVGFTLRQISGSVLWVLLGAYTIENYGVTEKLFGLIPTTNALMVVFLQLSVTRRTSRHHPLAVMALGTLLYGLGVGLIALGTGFWGFWFCMVIVTIGELMIIPTASSFTANRAPEAMRGRYMSLLTLTMGAGSMIGPLLGGFLNDAVSPQATWYGGGAVGILGGLIYLILIKAINNQKGTPTSDRPA